jgi:hypothetical protein
MGCEFMVLVVVLILLVVAVLTIKPNPISHEGFNSRGMGGQRYWGFGREYGFNILDSDINTPKHYQITPSDTCVPGYTRVLNLTTNRIECAENYFNY